MLVLHPQSITDSILTTKTYKTQQNMEKLTPQKLQKIAIAVESKPRTLRNLYA